MARDYLQYLVLTALNLAVSLILLYSFATFLDKSSYAEYGYLWTLASLFLILINAGHKDALFKYTSQNNTPDCELILGSSFFICTFLSVLFFVCWQTFNSNLALALFAVTGLQLINILATYYRGKSKYRQDVLTLCVYRLVWLLVFITFVYYGRDISENSVFIAGGLAGILVFLSAGGLNLIKKTGIKAAHTKKALANANVMHFFIIELVTVSFMKSDVLLIKYFGIGSDELAEYFFSLQVFEAAILLLAPVTFLFFNRYNQSRSRNAQSRLLVKSMLILSFTFVIGLLVWWLLGEFILHSLFPHYMDSFELILILTLALLPNAINALLSALLFANHKEKIFVKVSLFGLFVLLLLDSTLIPTYGVTGAAYGRLASEMVIAVILFVCTLKVIPEAKNKS